MFKKGVDLYLKDILTSIKRIKAYSQALNSQEFKKDQKTIDAIIKNFCVIGEAVKAVPRRLKLEYSQVPWWEMRAARNKLIHACFTIDKEILWKTIKDELPGLQKQIITVLKTYNKTN